jgi:hypothetical protein
MSQAQRYVNAKQDALIAHLRLQRARWQATEICLRYHMGFNMHIFVLVVQFLWGANSIFVLSYIYITNVCG